jgi:nitrate reductase NapE component
MVGSGIKSRDPSTSLRAGSRGRPSLHRESLHFAGKRARATWAFLLLAVVLFPTASHAYAGPGAGFAVLSSFWAIFVAFLYSFYALMTWPFRQLFRFLRRRNAYGKATFERAVILGFDGMDPELADRFMKRS